MTKVERRRMATSTFLTHVGRFQLVNSVLSFFGGVPVVVIEISKARCHYWRGCDSNGKMKPFLAWIKCSKQKRKGG
jgi:hypothetical protein